MACGCGCGCCTPAEQTEDKATDEGEVELTETAPTEA